MSVGSLRERVAEAVIGHLGDRGQIGLPCALVGTPRDEWCGRCDRNAKATDDVLAVVRVWLGSDEAREVVVRSGERPRRADAILAALIDKTKEGEV